jgi:hypothetical protein
MDEIIQMKVGRVRISMHDVIWFAIILTEKMKRIVQIQIVLEIYLDVSPHNYTLDCLSFDRVGDGIIECLGAADEFEHSRAINEDSGSNNGFRCFNDTKCLGRHQLCHTKTHCPFGGDETFCYSRRPICLIMDPSKSDKLVNTVCQIGITKQIHFSLETSPNYPPSKNRMIDHVRRLPEERQIVTKDLADVTNDASWTWRCNRGLYARFRSDKSNQSFQMFLSSNLLW